MKNGGLVYPPKVTSEDNLGLKRTLYALDHERRFKMRELDTKKKQFLHEHRAATSKNNGISSPKGRPTNFLDNIREKLERKREEEKQSALDLQNRSSDFIQELRVKPLSTLIKMERKPSPVESEDTSTTGIDKYEKPQQSISNKVMALYQKGFSGVMRREREKKANPFVQSVNSILENLKNEKDGSKTDPMRNFTRTILSKYAGLNTVDTDTISERNESASDIVSPQNVSPDSNTMEEEIAAVEAKMEARGDDYLKTAKYSSKGLQLWARVRREQNSIMPQNTRQNKEQINVTKADNQHKNVELVLRNKTPNKQNLSLNISKARAFPKSSTSPSPTEKSHSTNSASPTRHGFSHPKSPNSPCVNNMKTPTRDGSVSPGRGSVKSEGGGNRKIQPINHRKNSISGSKSATYNHRAGSSNTQPNKPITTSNYNKRKPLPIVAVEEHIEEQTHHTVVVVHDDNVDNEDHKSIQWDQSHRYSLFNDDAISKEESDHLKKIDKLNNHSGETLYRDETPQDLLAVNHLAKENNKSDNDSDIDDNCEVFNTSPESTTTEREELQPSALSMYSGSEMTTSAGTRTRSHSRQGGRKTRRLSVQTSGALRALSSVLNEESKLADKRENEASSYTSMVNALVDVANGVEEQARKLDNVRRVGHGMAGRESHVTSADRIPEDNGRYNNKRRSSIASSDRRSSSFVTNEVYKFLERRSSSKTMPRRQTLSKLELKLLSQAPGNDIVGRRSSFSSLTSSHRSSLDLPSTTPPSGRGSMSGSLGDVKASLLDLGIQNKTTRRHSMSAVSDRLSTASPRSVSRLSNISESESASGGGGGKDLETGKARSYSWAPDVSETTEGHILAMELLARNNRSGISKFRTVTHMLKCLGEEYRRQTASMMYEELRYCTYLRLAPHQIPADLKDSNVSKVFECED